MRKVLFDEGVPLPLKTKLIGWEVQTVQDIGLSGRDDAEVLKRAEADGYDIFLTTDKNIRNQQNIARLTIAIYELPTTSWPKLVSQIGEIVSDLKALAPDRTDIGEINVDE